jgi:RND family efflux transporter MFP subunit
MPIVRLSQNGLLRLILPVPESQVPLIRNGKTLSVTVPTLHRTFTGQIARFSNELQMSTRTMDAEVDVPNPELLIIPGMYAEVTLPLSETRNVLAVPLQALGGAEDKRTVFLVDSGGRIEEKPVEVGIETSDSAEIKAGLSAGDLVVVGSRSQLKPGQQVTPKVIGAPGAQGGA